MVVTECGVADLRAKSDAGKIASDYQIPGQFQNNTPQRIDQLVDDWQAKSYFPTFPLDTDFTDEEIVLGRSPRKIKALANDPKALTWKITATYGRYDFCSVKPCNREQKIVCPASVTAA